MSPRGISAPPAELPELPTVALGGERLWRIHAASAEPWFFDTGPHGRFNLAAVGTCYLAEQRLGAFVEKFVRLLRPGGPIPESLVESQRLSSLRPPRREVVDLTDRRVLGRAGLTAEIHSTTDYALTQSWALALRDAGYRGIRYRARHDPRGELTSIALFGSSRPPRSAARTAPIPLELVHEASETFGIAVLPKRLPRNA